MSSAACSSWCRNVCTSCARRAGSRSAEVDGVFRARAPMTSAAGRPGRATRRDGAPSSQSVGGGGGASFVARSRVIT